MNAESKRIILQQRVELLRGHIETVGSSPGFERALEQTENELRALEREPTPARS